MPLFDSGVLRVLSSSELVILQNETFASTGTTIVSRRLFLRGLFYWQKMPRKTLKTRKTLPNLLGTKNGGRGGRSDFGPRTWRIKH